MKKVKRMHERATERVKLRRRKKIYGERGAKKKKKFFIISEEMKCWKGRKNQQDSLPPPAVL
jgi:hypothetical protein